MHLEFILKPRYVASCLLVLSSLLLLFFNSCQGPLGAKGFQASNQSICTEKPGLVRKLNLSVEEKQDILRASPSVFDQKKLQLGFEDEVVGTYSKTTDQVLVAGTELSVVVDNVCLDELKHFHSQVPFSSKVALSSMAIEDLKIQNYAYTLPEDIFVSQFEEELNRDVCVKGVTYEKGYELTSFSLNDPYAATRQQHFNALNAYEAYAKFYSEPYGMKKASGPRVIVAVLDTGIDWTHPELAPNIWKYREGPPTLWGLNAPTLGNIAGTDYNPIDDAPNGHGTHVAGIIAAVSNNNQAVAGVMPFRSQIMAIKVFKLEDGTLKTTTTIVSNAIRWAADQGANVINLSLAKLENITAPGGGRDASYEAALQYAINAGVFVVAAAGNATATFPAQEINNTFTVLPARYAKDYSGMISVGSFNVGDGYKSYFSHWGRDYIEIGAPGTQSNGSGSAAGIFSTLPFSVGQKTGYGALEGTSMAAPMVAGAAALTIGLIRESYGLVPNPAEVKRLLLASAQKTSALSNHFKDGNRLNLNTLVDQIHKDYPLTKGGTISDGGGNGSLDIPSVGCP